MNSEQLTDQGGPVPGTLLPRILSVWALGAREKLDPAIIVLLKERGTHNLWSIFRP